MFKKIMGSLGLDMEGHVSEERRKERERMEQDIYNAESAPWGNTEIVTKGEVAYEVCYIDPDNIPLDKEYSSYNLERVVVIKDKGGDSMSALTFLSNGRLGKDQTPVVILTQDQEPSFRQYGFNSAGADGVVSEFKNKESFENYMFNVAHQWYGSILNQPTEPSVSLEARDTITLSGREFKVRNK